MVGPTLAARFELFDLARIDHFRGFVSYWAVPAGSRVRPGGGVEARPGPRAVRRRARVAGQLPLIAEDLGVITPAVEGLRESLGLPGMVDPPVRLTATADTVHGPDNHAENRVVYTGTHDNDTMRGWYASLDPATARGGRPRARARRAWRTTTSGGA